MLNSEESEVNVALSILADRALQHQGGVLLTIFVERISPTRYRSRYILNLRDGETAGFGVEALQRALDFEFHSALSRLRRELDAERGASPGCNYNHL
jgi:hypothetical protein